MENPAMQHTKRIRTQRGFTLMEVLVASAVLLIGIVAVAQLVPVSVGLDANNRRDTTSLVIAQREMDALMSQPMANTTFQDACTPAGSPNTCFTCPFNAVCNLGGAAANPPACAGNCPTLNIGNRPFINFNAAAVAGYSFNYTDPNDTSGSYDIRWAVFAYGNAAATYGKRFVVGVRRIGGNGAFLPISLDSMVEK